MADGYREYEDGSARCLPGNREFPDRCSWHSEHHWCSTCKGWYGVPHERIHDGPNAHPVPMHVRAGCVCRPCTTERNERDEQERSDL